MLHNIHKLRLIKAARHASILNNSIHILEKINLKELKDSCEIRLLKEQIILLQIKRAQYELYFRLRIENLAQKLSTFKINVKNRITILKKDIVNGYVIIDTSEEYVYLFTEGIITHKRNLSFNNMEQNDTVILE